MFSLAASCLLVGALAEQQDATEKWNAYKLAYGKEYTNRIEDSIRQKIFLTSKKRIEKFNAEESEKAGYKKGLNQMSDWTEAEKQRTLGFNMRGSKRIENTRDGEEYLARLLSEARSKPLPASVDWRQVEGRVTSVKDQGQCGSCWAFSTTGLLEGQQLKVTGRKELVDLSAQNLVDCVTTDGCNGDWPTHALQFIYVMGGIDDANSYPYNDTKQYGCDFNDTNVVMTDRGPITLPIDEEVLKAVVAVYGPVSVAMFVDPAFHDYKSGVYSSEHCKVPSWLNHAVLIVGYGTDPKEGDYWLIVSIRNQTSLTFYSTHIFSRLTLSEISI